MNEKTQARNYRDIKEDYQFVEDIFTEEDDKTRKLKWILDNRLPDEDRIIIVLYAEYGSLRKLGEKLGLSHTTIRKEVLRIKNTIIKEYYDLL